MIDNIQVSFEAPLIFFGNLSAVSNKLTPPKIMIIGFITPFLAEGYQFIFKCGQVDVDDIVLNFGGFMIAYLVYILIYKFKLKDTATA
jgi:glycopeptide antibiotics resistance protein